VNLPGCPETAIYPRATETDTMTAERTKAMHIGIMLSLVPQVAEEQVLLDSGASKNLIYEES
jgi:hypothetical protein